MDALRNWVLVTERLAAGVDDGGAVQQGHITFAVREETKKLSSQSLFIRAERKQTSCRSTAGRIITLFPDMKESTRNNAETFKNLVIRHD